MPEDKLITLAAEMATQLNQARKKELDRARRLLLKAQELEEKLQDYSAVKSLFKKTDYDYDSTT